MPPSLSQGCTQWTHSHHPPKTVPIARICRFWCRPCAAWWVKPSPSCALRGRKRRLHSSYRCGAAMMFSLCFFSSFSSVCTRRQVHLSGLPRTLLSNAPCRHTGAFVSLDKATREKQVQHRRSPTTSRKMLGPGRTSWLQVRNFVPALSTACHPTQIWSKSPL